MIGIDYAEYYNWKEIFTCIKAKSWGPFESTELIPEDIPDAYNQLSYNQVSFCIACAKDSFAISSLPKELLSA